MSQSVSLQHKMFLGVGFLGIFFSFQGVGILAIPYYQMTLGVDPFLLALAIKIPLLLAALFAPIIGQFSDQLETKYGRRRPFLFIFPWLSGIVFGLIWMVPSSYTPTEQLIYFATLVLIFHILSTCWTVPMNCLVYEATTDHHEKTRVIGFATYFIKFGSIIYQWFFPIAQLSIFGGIVLGMQYLGWGMALICFGLCGSLPAFFIKERQFTSVQKKKKNSLFINLKAVTTRKNVLVLLGLLFIQMGIGSYAASMDYYVIVYHMFDGSVADGATWKAILSTAYAITGILGVYLLTKISAIYGKINTLKIVYVITFLGGALKWFLYQPNVGWWLVVDAILCSLIWGSMAILVTSMMADQIDIDENENGVRREGIYISMQNWAIAVAGTIAILSSGMTLNLIGFNALQGSSQISSSLFAMRIILVGGTCLASILGYVVLTKYKVENRENKLKLGK